MVMRWALQCWSTETLNSVLSLSHLPFDVHNITYNIPYRTSRLVDRDHPLSCNEKKKQQKCFSVRTKIFSSSNFEACRFSSSSSPSPSPPATLDARSFTRWFLHLWCRMWCVKKLVGIELRDKNLRIHELKSIEFSFDRIAWKYFLNRFSLNR